MATELATAYVSIIPSAKGFGRKLATELGDLPSLGASAGQEMGAGAQSGFSAGFLAKTAGLLAIGGGAAALILKGFDDAMDRGRSSDKLAAQLGLDDQESERLGSIAGDLYADAFGDNFGHVNEALGAVVSTFGDMGDKELRDLTEDALNLAEAFDKDVGGTVSEVGSLISQGLVEDAQEGFDVTVRALQEIPAELRASLGEATSEYSRFFSDLGFSASEMFDLFAQADDQFALDKTGDAIKEFTIRSTDMSVLTESAFDTIGLNAEVMAGRIVAGGDTARTAFDEIITGLLSVADPVAQANAAIALFGTPLEDLGVNEIPAFLTNLAEMKGGLENVGGAADAMGTTLNDNAATKIEEFKREALGGLTQFIADNVLPDVEKMGDAFKEDGLGAALDVFTEDVLPRWIDDVSTWMDEEGIDAFTEFGVDLGSALGKGLAKSFANAFTESWDFLSKGELGIDLPIHLPSVPWPGLAHGGDVQAGHPYIVGDRNGMRNAELFVPDTNGTVLPEVPGGWGSSGPLVGSLTVLQMPGENSVLTAARELRRMQLMATA